MINYVILKTFIILVELSKEELRVWFASEYDDIPRAGQQRRRLSHSDISGVKPAKRRRGHFAKRQKANDTTPSTTAKRKIKWFEEFRTSADTQVKRYEQTLKSLESGEKVDVSEMAEADNMSAIEKVLDENISRSATLEME